MFDFKKLNPNNIKPEDISEDTIQSAFEKLKEYCEENKINMKEFIHNDENIAHAGEIIHSKLNMAQRTILSKKKITSLIETHIDFIRNKVDELSSSNSDKVAKTNKAVQDLDELF